MRTHITNYSRSVAGVLALAVLTFSLVVLRSASAAIFNDPSQPVVGPGVAQVGSNAPKSALSNTKAGSVLFFHKYTSDSANASNVNTLLSLTNTNPRDGITVRLFFVHDCQVDSSFVNLAGNQTRTFLASSANPGKTGYVVAVAVNPQGAPSQFNWLIGSASLRDVNGHEAVYNAVSVAKRTAGAAPVDGSNAAMNFNNVDYDRLPQLVALDNIQSQSGSPDNAVRTDVAVYSPLSNLSTTSTQGLKFTATAYDQNVRAFPQVVETTCGLNGSVGSIWTAPSIDSIVQAGRPGWGTFAAAANDAPVPVLGLSLSDGVSTQSHNARQMQALSYLDSFTMNMPVVLPSSPAAEVFTDNQPDPTDGSQGAGELKAGSVLIFPRFTSGTYGSSQINITNTHPTQRVRIRVFFSGLADPAAVNETIISLLGNQTTTINPNNFAPNQKGWVLAVAIDERGVPFDFNSLIGSTQVREQSGQTAAFNALAVAKNSPGPLPREGDVQTTDLRFNGTDYDRLPATLAFSGLASQLDNVTTLGYARAAISLLETPNIRGAVQTVAYDDLLVQASAVASGLETNLATLRPNVTAPPITSTIAKGHRGWFKLTPGSPIFGWTSNLKSAPFVVSGVTQAWTGGFNGGATPHILATTDTFAIKTAANNPNNGTPIADFELVDPTPEARSAAGTIVRLDARPSSDPNPGDSLTYAWFDNDVLVSTAQVSDYRLSIGAHTLKLIVTDGSGIPSEPAMADVQVQDTVGPIISGIPSNIIKTTSSSIGAPLLFQLPVAYDMVDGPVSVTSSVEPGSNFPVGRTTVTFTARDSAGNTTTATMVVIVRLGIFDFPQSGGVPGDKFPYLNNINDQYVLTTKARSIALQAFDDDNDPVTFTLLDAPPYARIENADLLTRKATLTLSPNQDSPTVPYLVRIVATDSRGGTFTTLPFIVQVSEVETDETGSGTGPGGGGSPGGNNNAPVARVAALPATAQATSKQGAAIQLDGSQSSDPDGDPLTYSWKDGNQVIADTAVANVSLAVGRHSITLTVTDNRGGSSTSAPQNVQVLPRPLSVASISPAMISHSSTLSRTTVITVTGSGFTQGMQARLDCTFFCSGGSQISVTVDSVEEDTIILSATAAPKAAAGNRDLILISPTGEQIKISRSNFVPQ